MNIAILTRYTEISSGKFTNKRYVLTGQFQEIASELGFKEVTMGMMIGKAVKLAAGMLDTHSREGVMDKEFIKQMARESDCPQTVCQEIDKITLARELWTLIPQENQQEFCKTLIRHCHTHCDPLLKNGSLKIILISEEGILW